LPPAAATWRAASAAIAEVVATATRVTGGAYQK
jgi:hypothetical protein